MNDQLPIIVRFQRGPENGEVWDCRVWYRNEYDSFPTAIVAIFNARAAIADLDFTEWGEGGGK